MIYDEENFSTFINQEDEETNLEDEGDAVFGNEDEEDEDEEETEEIE